MSILAIMQINRWLYQSSSPFAATCREKEKYPFIATNNWIVLAVQWPVKYFFAPNFPIFRKSCGEEEDGENRQMQSALLFKQTQKISVAIMNDIFQPRAVSYNLTLFQMGFFGAAHGWRGGGGGRGAIRPPP